MRRIFAAMLALAAFTATVALVNAMSGTVEAGFNFNIEDAAEHLALFIGEPLAAWAADAEVPLPNPGLLATFLGAFGLTVPALFAFTMFSD